jgi:hypothetical protein
MGMINSKQVTVQRINLEKNLQLVSRIKPVTNRALQCILCWKNLDTRTIFSGDQSTGFDWSPVTAVIQHLLPMIRPYPYLSH